MFENCEEMSEVYALYEDEIDSRCITRGRRTMLLIKNVNFHVIARYYYFLFCGYKTSMDRIKIKILGREKSDKMGQ